MNINFKVIGVTRLRIEPESTVSEADALTPRSFEPLNDATLSTSASSQYTTKIFSNNRAPGMANVRSSEYSRSRHTKDFNSSIHIFFATNVFVLYIRSFMIGIRNR